MATQDLNTEGPTPISSQRSAPPPLGPAFSPAKGLKSKSLDSQSRAEDPSPPLKWLLKNAVLKNT